MQTFFVYIVPLIPPINVNALPGPKRLYASKLVLTGHLLLFYPNPIALSVFSHFLLKVYTCPSKGSKGRVAVNEIVLPIAHRSQLSFFVLADK